MGARPLRRTIQREIEDALSEKILFNELRPGQIVVVDTDGDPETIENTKLVFRGADKPGHGARRGAGRPGQHRGWVRGRSR